MASPHVAGAVALLWSADLSWSATSIAPSRCCTTVLRRVSMVDCGSSPRPYRLTTSTASAGWTSWPRAILAATCAATRRPSSLRRRQPADRTMTVQSGLRPNWICIRGNHGADGMVQVPSLPTANHCSGSGTVQVRRFTASGRHEQLHRIPTRKRRSQLPQTDYRAISTITATRCLQNNRLGYNCHDDVSQKNRFPLSWYLVGWTMCVRLAACVRI